MLIGFDVGLLNERGTSVAVYDYAYYAQTILGHDFIVFYQGEASPPILDRFKKQFETISYNTLDDLQRAIEIRRIDLSYFIKQGDNDGRLSRSSKNAVHAIFQHFDPHGDVYAFASKWLANIQTGGLYPYVPHIVDLPPPDSNMRQELGIPPDAFVIGRHGACETFNLKFVHEAVIKALSKRKDLYFVFVNTHRFCEHERVIHLPVITDTVAKSNFINACDAMLHARSRGESFGLAVAEFIFFDKPVICWAGGVDRNHLEMLPDHRLVYRRNPDLLRILTSLEKCGGDGRWQDSVSAFTPPNVMRLF